MSEQTEKVVVYNHSEQKRCCGPLDLKIGANPDISRADLETAMKHPIFKEWKRRGIITFDENQDGTTIPPTTDDITKIPFNEAKTLVESTFEIAKLEAWKAQEQERKDAKGKEAARTSLIQLIDAQIEAEKGEQVGDVNKGKVNITKPGEDDEESGGSGSEE